ncbi:MAG TPA: hypothetical protein VI934_01110 [Candidatus Nanoarchaeia archaeon]|nr:hypothetical protein [Candidatus Nanoarchaeia archaeon]
MSFFSKILPWKRKDELGLKDNIALGGFGQPDNLGMGFGGQQFASQFPGGQGGLPQPFPGQQFSGGVGSMGGMPQPSQPEAFESNRAYERSYAAGKEIEVVSAKLDSIKASLETLNQRLAAIERYIQGNQDFKNRGW